MPNTLGKLSLLDEHWGVGGGGVPVTYEISPASRLALPLCAGTLGPHGSQQTTSQGSWGFVCKMALGSSKRNKACDGNEL